MRGFGELTADCATARSEPSALWEHPAPRLARYGSHAPRRTLYGNATFTSDRCVRQHPMNEALRVRTYIRALRDSCS